MSDSYDIENQNDEDFESIAIIGMACRLPGASNIHEYWDLIKNGTLAIKKISPDAPEDFTKEMNWVPYQGYLKGKEDFDSYFFGISPKEAETIDPQQRQFLECSWTALEDAGILPDKYDGKIGVFSGAGMNYSIYNKILKSTPQLEKAFDVLQFIGNEKDFLSTRVSHRLNLTGPSVNVQSACSTSLVAVHLACQSLLTYQSDVALSGGVSFQSPKTPGYYYKEGEIFSPTGRLRAFDNEADGTLFGEGVGILVLKRLSDAIEDGDRIYSVIKGSAINNDGSDKVGYTAPSVSGQSDCIRSALEFAEVEPETISYIETHGTGTAIGDSIEIAGLKQVFNDLESETVFLGSVKSNIGHLDVASGAAGLIKTTLMMHHKLIPPQIGFSEPNPDLKLEESPFTITKAPRPWVSSNGPLRAGISSFGMGGTNCHLILEEYSDITRKDESQDSVLLTLSAKDESALASSVDLLKSQYNNSNKVNREDLSHTLLFKRHTFPCRWAGVLSKTEFKDVDSVFTTNENTRVAFCFPGQGTQYAQMGERLYKAYPLFRKHLDFCFNYYVNNYSIDIKDIIFAESTMENFKEDTQIIQMSLFCLEYSLASFLGDLGIKPDFVMGHSLGEITAATIAGVFTPEAAMDFIYNRGEYLKETTSGKMLAVRADRETVIEFLIEKSWISAINSKDQIVLSGTSEAIDSVKKQLDVKGIRCTELKNKIPFHSPLVATAGEKIGDYIDNIGLSYPSVPMLSNVTGEYILPEDITRGSYWSRHTTEAVNFLGMTRNLLEKDNLIVLELGPGNVLQSLILNHESLRKTHYTLLSLPRANQKEHELTVFLSLVGRLYSTGLDMDFTPLFKSDRKYIPQSMGYYAFNREDNGHHTNASENTQYDSKALPIIQEELGTTRISAQDDFFSFGGNSLIAASIISRMNYQYGTEMKPTVIYDFPTAESLDGELDRELEHKTDITSLAIEKCTNCRELSPQQYGLWFEHELNPEKANYQLMHAVRICSDVSIPQMKAALEAFFKSQEAFYSYFPVKDGRPYLEKASDYNMPIAVCDYNEFADDKAKLDVFSQKIREVVQQPLDFTQYPLCKTEIHKLSPTDTRIILYIPHIISDGWSAELFRSTLHQNYLKLKNGETCLTEYAAVQYSDYVSWEEKKKKSPHNNDKNEKLYFWEKELKDIPLCHEIPLDRERKDELSGTGDLAEFHIASNVSEKIRDYCDKKNITPFNFFLGSFSLLLSKYSNQESVVCGTPYANRENREFDDIVGYFVQTLPIKIDIKNNLSIEDYFCEVKEKFVNSLKHSHVEMEEIIRSCGYERQPGINPLFQIIFAYQSYVKNGNEDFKLDYYNRGISEFDMSLFMWDDHHFQGGLEFSTDIFDRSTIENFLDHFAGIVEEMINPECQLISDITCVLNKEIDFIQSINKTSISDSTLTSFPALFEGALSRYGDQPAIHFENEILTYRELDILSRKLIYKLRENQVGKDEVIAVMLDRGPGVILSLLSILRTEAIYLPIDINLPEERILSILEDSKASAIIIDDEYPHLDSISIKKINLNPITGNRDNMIPVLEEELSEVDPHKPAYIIYTSGSTGRPKGAVIPHRALGNTLRNMKETLEFSKDDTMLAFSSISFDMSIIEYCLPLISGARIEMVDQYTAMDGPALSKVITERDVRFIQATPTTWNMLREAGWKGHSKMKGITGGEDVDTTLAEFLFDNTGMAWNGYGPTEATICSSLSRITGRDWVPNIGAPHINEEFYVLDSQLHLLPPGIPGELYIGGNCLSTGYLNRSKLTSELFLKIEIPGLGSKMLYRTGDLVELRREGYFIYQGRTDFQVKIRGFRIELQEIEEVYNQHSDINEAICIAHEYSKNDIRLILFYRGPNEILSKGLSQLASEFLPEYMRPSFYVYVPVFPKMMSGKVNRKKMVVPDLSEIDQFTREIISPRNELESKMLNVWKRILNVSEMGVRDNFFDLGGHSLLATKLISDLNSEFSAHWTLKDLFSNPSIEELSSIINSKNIHGNIPLIFPVQRNGNNTPLFLVAGAYYYNYNDENGESEYEMAFFRYFSNVVSLFENKRPVYGLRPKGILKGEVFHDSVHDMATNYIQEIKKIQSTGPYLIGGECLGGLVAYEICSQLVDNGEEVELLLLLDTIRNTNTNKFRFKVNNKLKEFKSGLKSSFSKEIIDRGSLQKDHLTPLKSLKKVFFPSNSEEKAYSSSLLGRWKYSSILISYIPKKYTGNTLLITNEEWNNNVLNLGWDSKICPNISIHEVPGTHENRLKGNNIKNVGKVINRYFSLI